jgi:hypothetical protein
MVQPTLKQGGQGVLAPAAGHCPKNSDAASSRPPAEHAVPLAAALHADAAQRPGGPSGNGTERLSGTQSRQQVNFGAIDKTQSAQHQQKQLAALRSPPAAKSHPQPKHQPAQQQLQQPHASMFAVHDQQPQQPQQQGEPDSKRAKKAPAPSAALEEIRTYYLDQLQQGRIKLLPSDPHAALQVIQWLLELDMAASMKTADGLQLLQEKMMGSADPWVHQALEAAVSRGVDWQRDVLALLQHLSLHLGSLLILNVGEVESVGTGHKRSHRKNKTQTQKHEKQQHSQTQGGSLLLALEADLQLPADLLQPAAQRMQAAAEQGGIQQHQVVRYGGSAQAGDAFAKQQRLDACSLHVRVSLSAGISARDFNSMSKTQWQAYVRQQKAALQPQLQQKLYATLAGLLKWQLLWQLRGEQRQLLEAGDFSLLQVDPSEGSWQVPADPTTGMRWLHM